MENFVFQNSTKIIFGKDTEIEIGKETRRHARKVLLHYGSRRIKENGLYDKIVASLRNAEVQLVELGGVLPNPRLSLVREGIELCRKEKVELVLAIGGGSAIDSAKAIAAGVPYLGDVWDFFSKGLVPERALPIGVVLTIPAAGSESSPNAVLTDEISGRKLPMRRAPVYPAFAIMNPELTYGLPPYHTACGLVDMFSHVLERYFSGVKGSGFVDSLAEATMRSIVKFGTLVMQEPQSYDYRAEVMWLGTIAHNGLLNTGSNFGDWATHAIEHEVSAAYDIAHGAGLAIVFPAWMKYVYKNNPYRFSCLGREVFGTEEKDELQSALSSIEAVKRFFSGLGLPSSLHEAGIEGSKFRQMAELCTSRGPIGNFVKLNSEDVYQILKLGA